MTENQCHAYRFTGERCTDVAGHESQHSFTIQWTDAECWTPGDLPPPSPVLTAEDVLRTHQAVQEIEDDDDLGDDGTKPPARCFACQHAWHGDEVCDRTTGGLECGCMTAVA